jgi:Xaa-Pro aminopeptidase
MTTPAAARRERLTRLRVDLAARGLDAALLTHAPNVRYLSGFSGSSGMLLVLPDESCLITDFRYREQAIAEVDGVAEVMQAENGLTSTLAGRLEDNAQVRKVAFEARKSAGELSSIEHAVRIAERALEETLGVIEEGVCEQELASELDYRLARHGSEGAPFDTIVASGERTALPHARPSERRLTEGDLLLLDFGATSAGYCSDITRTMILGEPRPWQREIHASVLEAQAAALHCIVPGEPASNPDRAARDCLKRAGLAERFGHSLGHGIGLEVHEGPRLHRRSKELLEVGNVVTVEPGVYLPGEGGVRIEEDVVIIDGGCRVLTSSSRALREL